MEEPHVDAALAEAETQRQARFEAAREAMVATFERERAAREAWANRTTGQRLRDGGKAVLILVALLIAILIGIGILSAANNYLGTQVPSYCTAPGSGTNPLIPDDPNCNPPPDGNQ